MAKKIVVSLCGGTDSAYLSCLDAGIDVSKDGEYEYHTSYNHNQCFFVPKLGNWGIVLHFS